MHSTSDTNHSQPTDERDADERAARAIARVRGNPVDVRHPRDLAIIIPGYDTIWVLSHDRVDAVVRGLWGVGIARQLARIVCGTGEVRALVALDSRWVHVCRVRLRATHRGGST